jgi:hypothetical protein
MLQRFMVAGIALAWSMVALAAAPTAQEEEARKHFDEGTAAYNLGEFVRAAGEYRAAYKLVHDPAMLYNVGQAYRLANDPKQALFFYRAYLRSVPNAANRSEVVDRINKLEAELNESPATPPPSPSAPTPAPGTSPSVAPLASVPEPSSSPSRVTVAIPQPIVGHSVERPVYKKWWPWTIAAVAIAAGVTVGVVLGTRGSPAPSTALGVTRVF